MKIINNMVLFWGNADVFSNWHRKAGQPVQFTIGGVSYNCSEQYMMHMKALMFHDSETAAKILATKNPRDQKALGREVVGYVDAVWKKFARELMVPGLTAKFLHNKDMLKVLLDTEDKLIVEASPYDPLWGVGLAEDDPRILDPATWQGKNWLGEVLMTTRTNLLEVV